MSAAFTGTLGLLFTGLHALADVRWSARTVFENVVGGAPPMAPVRESVDSGRDRARRAAGSEPLTEARQHVRLARALIGMGLIALSGPASAQPRRRNGVAFGGGSAKGIAHVGVIRWFEEHRIPIDVAAGTSMGGLVGGCFATLKNPREIGSSGWTRTSNPPVNRPKTVVLPPVAASCAKMPDREFDSINTGPIDEQRDAAISRPNPRLDVSNIFVGRLAVHQQSHGTAT